MGGANSLTTDIGQASVDSFAEQVFLFDLLSSKIIFIEHYQSYRAVSKIGGGGAGGDVTRLLISVSRVATGMGIFGHHGDGKIGVSGRVLPWDFVECVLGSNISQVAAIAGLFRCSFLI